MSICIDRFKNVIVNTGGIAHRTGWVCIPTFDKFGGISGGHLWRGHGYHSKGLFKTTTTGKPIHVSGHLTLEFFKAATGWEVPRV